MTSLADNSHGSVKKITTKLKSFYFKIYRKLYRWFIGIIGLSKGKDKTTRKLFTLFKFAIIIVISLLFIDIYSLPHGPDSSIGTFGDFFGGMVNPILTFLTFMGLLITIVLQQKELRASREELILSREEFKKSSAALTEQSQSIKVQNFENTFFNLISLHNEIVDSLEAGNPKVYKRNTFKHFITKIRLGTIIHQGSGPKPHTPIKNYDNNYKNIATIIEHYHKNLYQILNFVDQATIPGSKSQYTKFIRAQLSRDELHLLFFHGLSKYGKEKFKGLIEDYSMLEHIPEDMKYVSELMYFYKKRAFGDTPELLKQYDIVKQAESSGPPSVYGYRVDED